MYPSVLNSVVGALSSRFTMSREREDIDRAIKYQRTAVEIDQRRPGRARSFANLTQSLIVRFEIHGDQTILIKPLKPSIELWHLFQSTALRVYDLFRTLGTIFSCVRVF